MKRLLGGLLFAAGVAHAADMTVVRYVDQDAGDAPYATRLLVTADYLRMDGGDDEGDFVLLDRRRREVLNVMRDAGLVMVFASGALPAKPARWQAKLDTSMGAPGTERYRLSVDGVACSEGIVAPRAAPDVAKAMGELKRVLATTQHRVWRDSPPDMQHDCDLANQVWESGAVTGIGLPLEEREFTGRTRRFETQSTEPLRPELFRVPAGLPALNAPS